MKKVFRYLQDQAQAQSQARYSGSSYLSPPGKEPQQQHNHRKESNHHAHHDQQGYDHNPNSRPPLQDFPSCVSCTGGTLIAGKEMRRHQYAQDNILQNYDLYIPESNQSTTEPKYWLIYIHGGYFRDPKVTSSSFHGTIDQLVSKSAHTNHQSFAGYASINYRLSQHQNYPQDPQRTSDYEFRNAKWPEHIQDVQKAIAQLQHRHGFGENYILVGHSVGATMAILSLLSPDRYILHANSDYEKQVACPKSKFIPPKAVLGVCGIYDFPELHQAFPGYEQMLTRNAIPNKEDDIRASPAMYSVKDYKNDWTRNVGIGEIKGCDRRYMVLAHSRKDGLIDWGQVEAMQRIFDQAANGGDGVNDKIFFEVIGIQGSHNDIWEKDGGARLAELITETLQLIS